MRTSAIGGRYLTLRQGGWNAELAGDAVVLRKDALASHRPDVGRHGGRRQTREAG